MFKIRPEQSASLRRNVIAQGLVDTFKGTPLQASQNSSTGEVRSRDPKGNVTRFGFDEKGFVGRVTSPLGRSWKLENNRQGKMIGYANPAGLQLQFQYGASGALESVRRDSRKLAQFRYDAANRLEEIQFPDRTTTRFSYDLMSRVGQVKNRVEAVEKYEYSDQADAISAITDGNGNTTRIEPNSVGMPLRIRYPDGGSQSYRYDAGGLLSAISDGGRLTAEIRHDDEGHVRKIQYRDRRLIGYVYDSHGNLTEARCPEATVEFEYDAENRVVAERRDGTEVRYGYDACGALSWMQYPSGGKVAFERDADARLVLVQDWENGAHRFEHSEDDRKTVLHLPGPLVTTISRNDAGLATSFVTVDVRHEEQSCAFSYAYDDDDRIREFREAGKSARAYKYDAEGQLLAVRSDNERHAESFGYDAVGNRDRTLQGPAEFNSLNQLVRQGKTRFRYDDRGNLIWTGEDKAGWQFRYNAQNLMVRAESPDGKVTEFAYDAFGRRIRKRGPTGEVIYFWAGENMIAEVRRSGNPREKETVQEFLYMPGEQTPLACRIGREVYYYHTDALGTPRRMTNTRGEVVWAADYSAFGRTSESVSRVANPLRFPGQYYDEETGLHYNRFRYYSPLLGRYLSKDPITYLSGLNFYAYAGNDPIGNADPTGLVNWGAIGKAVLVGAVALAAGAAVIAFAPIALPLAIVAGGAVAGAVGGALNEVLDGDYCPKCIALAALRGAAVGIIASLPFLCVPAAAGVAAYAAAGAAGGAFGYGAGLAADYPNGHFSWKGLALSMGVGLVLGAAGRYVGGKYARWKAGRAAGDDPIAVRRVANEELRNSPQFKQDMAKVGVTDEQIAQMQAKQVPLGFKSEEQFTQFKQELGDAMKADGLGDAEVGMKGTSTTFYSENPGKPTGHHWDADPANPGDYDLNVTSPTMASDMNEAGIQPSEKYGVYKTSDMEGQYPAMDAFQQKWSGELGRDVNFVGYPEAQPRDSTEYILSKPDE